VHVEVAPEAHHVREIRGEYFHANHYRELFGIEQIISPSSQARVERADAILGETPVLEATGVLSVLGDRMDDVYPIYRTANPPDTDATLCTALFNLDACWLRIYTRHPTQAPEEFIELEMQPTS
jgi:hypothetical protein